MISRRGALGKGLAIGGGVAFASRAGAITIAIPPIEIRSARKTQGGWARGSCWPGAKSLLLDGKPVDLSADGQFFVAFDRDAGPQSKLDLIFANGGTASESLTIAPRPWRIERVNAPFHPPAMPDEAFAAIRKDELARIDKARSANLEAKGWRQNFQWPAKGRISGLFGSQRIYQGGIAGSYHSGLDIALPQGALYHAPADGIVTLAADQPFTLEGNLLMIDHGMGLVSAFLHSSELLVKAGETVSQGQPIGKVGRTGRASGPHLHWGLRWREARLDPLLLLGASA